MSELQNILKSIMKMETDIEKVQTAPDYKEGLMSFTQEIFTEEHRVKEASAFFERDYNHYSVSSRLEVADRYKEILEKAGKWKFEYQDIYNYISNLSAVMCG